MLQCNIRSEKMNSIDIPSIEKRARQLRAAEIQRLNGLFAERTLLLIRLAAGSLATGVLAIGAFLQPLFSWNPRALKARAEQDKGRGLEKISQAVFKFFSWNPQQRKSS
jgi:hypothetical protein